MEGINIVMIAVCIFGLVLLAILVDPKSKPDEPKISEEMMQKMTDHIIRHCEVDTLGNIKSVTIVINDETTMIMDCETHTWR